MNLDHFKSEISKEKHKELLLEALLIARNERCYSHPLKMNQQEIEKQSKSNTKGEGDSQAD